MVGAGLEWARVPGLIKAIDDEAINDSEAVVRRENNWRVQIRSLIGKGIKALDQLDSIRCQHSIKGQHFSKITGSY